LVKAVCKFLSVFSDYLIKLENQIALLLQVLRVLTLLRYKQIHLRNTKYSQSEFSFRHFRECILTCFVPHLKGLVAKLVCKLVFRLYCDLHLRNRNGLAGKHDPIRLENLLFVN